MTTNSLTDRRRLWDDLAALPSWTGAGVALLVLIVVTTIMNPAFRSPTNLVNILNQNAVVGIIGVGMTLVIILAGIDLAVGSLLALAGGLGILTLNALLGMEGVSEVTAVLGAMVVMLAVGAAAGALNGTLIAFGKVAPFIATLGGLVAYRSLAVYYAGGGQFFSQGSDLFAALGQGLPIPGTNIGRPGGRVIPFEIPYTVMVWCVVAVVGYVILNRTRLGRHIFAVGANERAARYSAVPVARIKLYTYTLIGLAAGVAAIMSAARYTSVNSSSTGLLIELEVIAAVVIGGTRMEGGAGSIAGTVIGVLLIGVIKNMMVMLSVDSHLHGLVMGVIIVLAVLAQQLGRWRTA
ncbi:MAG: ABC transporter permease [Phycisphaeraceae bacterium]